MGGMREHSRLQGLGEVQSDGDSKCGYLLHTRVMKGLKSGSDPIRSLF